MAQLRIETEKLVLDSETDERKWTVSAAGYVKGLSLLQETGDAVLKQQLGNASESGFCVAVAGDNDCVIQGVLVRNRVGIEQEGQARQDQ